MPMLLHTNWRDCQEWKSFGMPMSTTSNEACKMYDATLSQFSSAYDDPTVGGFEGTMAQMLQADPTFVPGIALKLGLAAQGGAKRSYNDPNIAEEAQRMMELAEKPHVKEWERNHARAVNLYLNGRRDQAVDVFEDSLIDYPLDMAAIKLVNVMNAEFGYFNRLRDCCGRVLPHWKETTPFYGDMLSWYGFALEETNYFREAEQYAKKALEINPNDAFAVHCMAHIREMTGDFKDGADFMKETENNWNASMYNCHIYWHWALFKYENGDFEAAKDILDAQLLPLMKKHKTAFNVTDVASLMFRLEAEGVKLDGWDDCFEVSSDHLDDYAWSFYDVNVLLACAGAKRKQDVNKLVEKVKEVIRTGDCDNPRVYKEATLPVFEAIQAYENEDFDTAVECLKPVRYELHKIGGSNAQRDLFNVLLIECAIRSTNYKKLANHLIAERQSVRGDTPLMQKMMQKLVIEH